MHRIDISFGVCLTFDFGQLLFLSPYQSSVLAHPLEVHTPFLISKNEKAFILGLLGDILAARKGKTARTS